MALIYLLEISVTTSSARKALLGTAGKHKLPELVAPPPPTTLEPPSHFTGRALEMWRELAAKLEGLGLFSELDYPALCHLCHAWHESEYLREELKKNGYTQTNDRGMITANPMTYMASNADKKLLAMLKEFGLTPAARRKVDKVPKQDPKKNEFF